MSVSFRSYNFVPRVHVFIVHSVYLHDCTILLVPLALRAKQTSITSNGDPLGIFTIHTPAFHSLKLLLQLNL